MNILLRVAERAWRGVNRLRRALYRRGVLRAKRLPRPVISIGNIAVGGAGKTPTVIRVAQLFTARGKRVAVLTRGYGRNEEGFAIVQTLDAARYGDEPIVIKRRVESCDVIVGKTRYENARRYLDENDCDLFILDDGFQHLQLHRDFDIVIDTPHARYLREGRDALSAADHILVRGQTLNVSPRLGSVTQGTKVFAFAGLADNEQFFRSIEAAGLVIAGRRGFPDHHRYTAADIDALREAAESSGAQTLVTTEKDAVKIQQPDIIAISAEAVIEHERALVDKILARIGR